MGHLRGRGERRRWSATEKRRIIAEALAPGGCAAEVARRYALNLNQLYTWCRPFRRKLPADVGSAVVPIDIRETSGDAAPGLMSISMPSGIRIELEASADEAVLRRVISVLRSVG